MNSFVCILLLFGFIHTNADMLLSTGPLILTPYIHSGQIADARNLSLVDPKLFLNVTSYSGFLTVNEKYDSNLFFWYFPVANQTKDTPWIIWLQGGPGATSLAGLFAEIGPFVYDHEKVLKLREWSWHRKYPLLFIDNPVGAGFSFTSSPDGYVQNMDDCSEHLYSALQQFLELFPERRSAPLYLAGESYAGHYLPAFGHKILHPPRLPELKLNISAVNLKGIMMGNPVIDRKDFVDVTSVYYKWGLIDSQGVEALRPLQEKYTKAVQQGDYTAAYEARDKLLDKINDRVSQPQMYNVLKGKLPEVYSFEEFVTSPQVTQAIHVGTKKFSFSNPTVHIKLIKDFVVSMTPQVEELLEHYRIMIYCGQLDLVAPCVENGAARRKTWRWSGREEFLAAHREPWWNFAKEEMSGYVKSGGNFTEVLVRGAGHLAPMEKPDEVFELIDYFIRGLDLPKPSNYNENQNDTPPYLDEHPDLITEVTNYGFIASVAFNIIFAILIVAGVIYGIKWKRRTETHFYTTVDNDFSGVLTMD